MAKKSRLTVATSVGTFTRETARAYTHVVVASAYRAEWLEANRVNEIKDRRREVARYRRIVATGVDPEAGPAGTIGGDHGRRCTAMMLADGSFARWIASGDEQIAALEARGVITDDDASNGWVALGWCSRLDLARKLAVSGGASAYRHVRIFEVATGQAVR